MVKIDCLIFGYRRLKIDPEKCSELTSICIRAGIFSTISDNGDVIVRERDFEKICKLLQGRVKFTYSEPLGIYGKWLTLRHKGAVLSALAISVALTIVLSSVVWDVRVSGNENISDREIIDALDSQGFGIGDFWLLCDRGRLESEFLADNPRIAWININRRGTVAYVRVIESQADTEQAEPPRSGYSNILATRDCVIEEITVKSGTAVVKPGDVVKKGDLLVAGILPAEAGGGFCYAEATVIGRVADSISAELDRNYEKKEYIDRRIAKIQLNFFDFSVNIFKIYGNLTNECDIIEDEIEYTHLDKYRLPFSITVSYLPIFELSEASYTDEELVELVSERLNALINKRLGSADLLKIRTYGEFTDLGYRMHSEIVMLCQVGENKDFK